ncbi:MAG: ABC transporter permease [Planctomycetota bacterium]|jgi:ABC-type transport system involved in multi-copper enzyme maturation permease subunit
MQAVAATVRGGITSATRIWAVVLGDLRVLSRGHRWWVVRLAFAVILVLTVYSAWPEGVDSILEMSRFGAQVFNAFFMAAYVTVLFLTPALFSRVIASGIQDQTSPILFSTPLKSWEIVAGKFLSHFCLLLLVLACGIPVLFSTLLFGGVGGGQVLLAAVALLLLGFLGGALTTFLSTLVKKPYLAALLAYVALVGVAITGSQLMAFATLWTVMGKGPAWSSYISLAAPHVALTFLPFDTVGFSKPPAWAVILECIVMGLAFLAFSSLLLRRMVLRAPPGGVPVKARKPRPPGGQIPETPRKKRILRARPYRGPVWSNPVMWSEVKVRRSLAGRVAMILGIVILAIVGLNTIGLFALIPGQKPQPVEIFKIFQNVIVMGEVFLLSILVASLAGSALGGEREEGKLEILASTPLSSVDIFRGKFIGVFYSLRFFWALIGLQILTSLLVSIHVTTAGRIVFGLLLPCLLVLSTAFVCAVGLFLSLFGRTTTLGVTATFGALLAWWIGAPLVFQIFDLPMKETSSGANPFVTAVTIIDLWVPEMRYYPSETGWLEWPYRAIGPVVGTLVFLAVATFLLRRAFIWRFDRALGRS